MKRLHIHISVDVLSESIKFYSKILNAPPRVIHKDYAKWQLNDPQVNFAISKRGHARGVDHLGIQADSKKEFQEIAENFKAAETKSFHQEDASCCYARSNKHWTLDPQGIAWETFLTVRDLPVFGADKKADSDHPSSACCVPLYKNQSNDDESGACCIPAEGDAAGCCA